MTQTQHAAPQTGAVYSLVGTLIEACSCGVNCPCWIGEDPDLGECFAIVAYGLDQGRIRGVDVSGLNLVLIAHIPGNVLAGNWEIVALVDERATPEQRDLLLGAFTGKLGGPLADLAQLVGSVKGVEFVPISHQVEGGPAPCGSRGWWRQRWTRTGARTGASPPCRTRSSPRCRAPPPGWPRPA
jgi:hypothetical protein